MGQARLGWQIGIVRGIIALTAALCCVAAPATAQMQTIDPNSAIDADLDRPAPPAAPTPRSAGNATDGLRLPPPANDAPAAPAGAGWTTEGLEPAGGQTAGGAAATGASTDGAATAAASANGQTYRKDDLIGAAEGVFGHGAEGLARLIENILREQGEPDGYIVGREAGGALVFGVRYGSGTLHHRVEGTMPVYWTGPSVGFDAGANAASTFVLVYNLHDTADIYHRFPAGEGTAYFVGGFNASYLRRRDVVLIPIRLGVGARLGVNVGYMKFSERQRWLPF